MGVWSAFKERDLGYLWLPEDEIQRGKDLDSRLLQEVQDDYARGAISSEVAAQSTQNLTDAAFRNQVAQSNPWDGFKEGAKEGYNNVASKIQGLTSGVLGGVWGLIPWQVKIGALIFAVIYFWPIIRPFAGKIIGRFAGGK